jgi:short-subunit dehydrogenase
MEQTLERFGCIDVCVLCAGIGAHHRFKDTQNLAMFRKLMDVNFFGYLHCVRHAYDALVRSRGLLVAITSFSGEVGLPFRTAYCASKFATTGFLEALRAEMQVSNEGFDITIVCPPTVDTNLRKNSLTTDAQFKKAKAPVDKKVTVEECAAIIVDSADRRLRKAFFPWKSFVSAYLRPLIPGVIDVPLFKRAML